MKVAFGISLSPGTPLLQEKDTRRFIDLAKMADDYGAEAVGTHDTAFIGGDAYVRTTLIALGAARARVGLRPTNPLTREPQVMASFLASVDSLTGGRAFMDMASGDSAGLNIGYEGATRAQNAHALHVILDPGAGGDLVADVEARAVAAGHVHEGPAAGEAVDRRQEGRHDLRLAGERVRGTKADASAQRAERDQRG